MHKVDAKVKEQLWDGQCGELRHGAQLAIIPGPGPVKGRKKAEVQTEMVTELVKIAFQAGLDFGYDMGAKVFGADEES